MNSKNNSPILSIVVPTKDRHGTLSVLMNYILGWYSQDFELIVHDNSRDNSKLLALVKDNLNDPRLSYFHVKQPVTMVENCSAAISKANGYFICFLGDDDGLIESTVELCKWLKLNNYDSATFKRPRYDWPNLTNDASTTRETTGLLMCPRFDARVVDVDANVELKRYLTAGATNIIYRGPFPYNGLITRNIFEQIKEKTGTYFPAPTPDVACAVSGSLLAKNHAYIELPYICGGQSYKSAAGLGRRGQHVGEVSDIKSLPELTAGNWAPELPHFWSGFTINAESAVKTLESWGRMELRDSFNFNRTIAACILYLNKAYRLRSIRHVSKVSKSGLYKVRMSRVLLELVSIQMSRTWNLVKRRASPAKKSHHIDIAVALDHIQGTISERFPDLAPGKNFSGDRLLGKQCEN